MILSRKPNISINVTGTDAANPTPVTGMVKCVASVGSAVPLLNAVGSAPPHRRRTYVFGVPPYVLTTLKYVS